MNVLKHYIFKLTFIFIFFWRPNGHFYIARHALDANVFLSTSLKSRCLLQVSGCQKTKLFSTDYHTCKTRKIRLSTDLPAECQWHAGSRSAVIFDILPRHSNGLFDYNSWTKGVCCTSYSSASNVFQNIRRARSRTRFTIISRNIIPGRYSGVVLFFSLLSATLRTSNAKRCFVRRSRVRGKKKKIQTY